MPLLRDATAGDLPFLESLYFALHREEFLPLGLPEAQLQGLLAMQARAQRLGYARDFPDAMDRIVFEKDASGETPIGRLLVAVLPTEVRLVDIALLPAFQGRGVGTALLEDLQRNAAVRELPLRLEVRPANRAFHLYMRLGFRLRASAAAAAPELAMEWTARGSMTEPGAELFGAVEGGLEEASELSRRWEQGVGTRFAVAIKDAEPLELVLFQFERHGPASTNRFSLLFRGPLEPIMPQQIYALSAVDVAGDENRVESLFLVPIGPENGAMRYEAVFNG